MSISMSVSTPSSTITIHLPHLTQLAPWPIPYAPLTTHFTPPSGCETWTLITNKPTVTGTAIGQYINLLDTNDKTCFPPGYGKDVWSATFSPGIYCPSGYVTAATGTEVGSAVWESGIPHSSDVTTVACCLRGFTYNYHSGKSAYDECTSVYDHSTIVAQEEYLPSNNQFVYTKPVEVGPGTAYARVVHLHYKQEEYQQYFTGTPIETWKPKGTIVLPRPSEGLSKGAIAGIAVGAAVGGLLLLGVLIFFIRRHRKNRLSQKNSAPPSIEEVVDHPKPAPWEAPEQPAEQHESRGRRKRHR